MSQRDQSGSGQRASGGGRGGSHQTSRPTNFDDDGFELPVWGEPSATGRSSSRPSRQTRSQNPEIPAEERPRRSAGTDRIPSLGDAFGRRESRRASREETAPYDDSEQRTPADDPYDRLRVQSARQRRAAPIDEFGVDDWSEQYAPAPARYPGGAQSRPRRTEPGRHAKAPNFGAAIQFANQFERPVVITLGIGLVSLVLMAATIAARQSRLADWMPIHLNAAGAPDHWGSPSTLWRLPLMVVMVTLMSAVLAWFAAKRDAFVVQFVLASTLLIQALCWVALVNLAW
jgi:hypothetical protein